MTLTVEAITAGYRRQSPVLRELSTSMRQGAVTAIVGPNGAGKTTLLRALGGMLRPWSGRVLLHGAPVSDMSRRRRAGVVTYVAQRPTVSAHFDVREVVSLGRYALPRSSGAVDRALDRLHLADLGDRWFHELSVGQQHRVAFARALAQLDGWSSREPRACALLTDEPLAAMDPRHALETLRTLRTLADEGVCVVVVMHDVNAALLLADDALLLQGDGRLRSAGSASDVLCPDALEDVFGVRYRAAQAPDGRSLMIAVSDLSQPGDTPADTMPNGDP